ncbi:putative serpin-like protein [Leptotrombidium deliense]|uniref:Putative serpin-like protein n=1 Tax=Leptotrombidium deliense TaxID=299467 RepID=A0A443SGL8_9ACAR|nr:putative serpin-like protein [Leptotrombidium deliense]
MYSVIILIKIVFLVSVSANKELRARRKIANASFENSFAVLKSYLEKNEVNPTHDALNVLAGTACMIRRLDEQDGKKIFKSFRYNTSFNDINEVEDTFNNTDLTKLYEQKNILLLSNKLNASDKFCEYLRNYKYADFRENVDFDKESKMNETELKEYIKKETKHTVDKGFSKFMKFNSSDQLVYLSSSRLNETFKIKFDRNNTKNGTFYNNGVEKRKIKFMNHKAEYKHYEDEQLCAVDIPYVSGNHLLVIVPKKKTGYKECIESMTLEKVMHILNNLKVKLVALKLPHFQTISAKNLNTFESENLYAQLLSSNASLTDVAEDQKVQMSQIHTMTSFKVDEEGTKVAIAVKRVHLKQKEVIALGNLEEVKCSANRPFIYYVLSMRANIVIFTGYVNNLKS